MLIKCHGTSMNGINEEFCFDGNSFKKIFHNTTTDDENRIKNNNCNWIIIDYELQLKTSLKINIPVGDERFYKAVEFITIFVSWIGVACLVFTLNKKYEKLQKKFR